MAHAYSYEVTISFAEPDLREPLLRWLREGHVADVVAAGAQSAEIVLLDDGAIAVRYRFSSREAFELYERDHAGRLRAEGSRLFPIENGYSYQRRAGTIAARFAADERIA